MSYGPSRPVMKNEVLENTKNLLRATQGVTNIKVPVGRWYSEKILTSRKSSELQLDLNFIPFAVSLQHNLFFKHV